MKRSSRWRRFDCRSLASGAGCEPAPTRFQWALRRPHAISCGRLIGPRKCPLMSRLPPYEQAGASGTLSLRTLASDHCLFMSQVVPLVPSALALWQTPTGPHFIREGLRQQWASYQLPRASEPTYQRSQPPYEQGYHDQCPSYQDRITPMEANHHSTPLPGAALLPTCASTHS